AKGNLNLPEGRLCPQQRLQRLLLQRNRVLPLHALQLVRRRRHRLGRGLHVLLKAGKLLVRCRQITAPHTRRKRHHLIAQLLLRIRKELTRHRRVLRRRSLVILLLPRRSNQFLLALRYISLVVLPSPTATASTAALLRLRKLALERI